MHRSWGLFFGLLCGCHGEAVNAAAPDASIDTAVDAAVEATGDTATSDSATTDSTPGDVGEVEAACAVPGNLVVNGDYSMGASGWSNGGFDVEPISGPCGKALRLTNNADYSELNQYITSSPLKKGTRYHLRVLFRNPGRDAGQIPAVLARFFHHDDAGDEIYTQTLVVQALNNKDWHLVELAMALERDEERLLIYTLSEDAKGQTFDIGLVSLVTE